MAAALSALRRHRGRHRVRRSRKARRLRALISGDLFYRVQAACWASSEHHATAAGAPGLPIARLRALRVRGRGLAGSWSKGPGPTTNQREVTFREGIARAGFQEAFEGECSTFISELHEDVDLPGCVGATCERIDGSCAPRALRDNRSSRRVVADGSARTPENVHAALAVDMNALCRNLGRGFCGVSLR